jgi:hypothetical protein
VVGCLALTMVIAVIAALTVYGGIQLWQEVLQR